MANLKLQIEGVPVANIFAQDENMRREFQLPLDSWAGAAIDGWADHSDFDEIIERVEEDVKENLKVGWHSDKAIYSERDWRKKYIKDAAEDPFSRYAVIAFGIGGELTAVGLRSTYLKDLYHTVADYIPGIVVESDMIIFGQPFQPLYFYLDAMRECARQLAASSDTDQEDLESLVNFYQKWIQPSHDRIRSKIKSKSVDFNQLWALFKPGELIYSIDEWDNPQIFYACTSAYREGGREYGDNEEDEDEAKIKKMTQYITTLNLNQPKRFCFDCWNVRWDPSTKKFTRSLSTFKIVNFRGTRRIASLPYYPLEMYIENNPEEAHLMDRIKKRGNIWKELVSGSPVPRKYEGAAIELEPGLMATSVRGDRVNLKDRVVVDNDGNSRMLEQSIGPMPNMKELIEPMMATMQLFSHKEPPIKLGDFDERNADLDDVDAKGDFNDLQALLCPASLNCFSLTMRKWFAVSIDNLSEIKWNKSAWDHLVLDNETKLTIRTLVANHRTKSKNPNDEVMTGDVIERKGSGLVIVLYGPPGVGKTLTAESVAEYTQRPLYAINVGEVTSEERVRARLQQVFTQASRWNAVLLLDEADVVLEKRSFEDIRRNGTVSVFLQMLEYYEGVLFLTTNRLEHIDNAFQSRINLAYEYPKLKESQRRDIWENFIKGLPESDATAKEQLEARLDSLATLDLNGRQIRNVLFTARSLVHNGSDGEQFSYTHVKQIIDHTKKLQEFFNKGKQGASTRLVESASRAPVAWDA